MHQISNEGETHGPRVDLGAHKRWWVGALKLVSEPKPYESVESSGLTPSGMRVQMCNENVALC